MNEYSTSKILGKLRVIEGEEHSEKCLNQETPVQREASDADQLKQEEEPKLGKVLANILGISFSKKPSPMDKY